MLKSENQLKITGGYYITSQTYVRYVGTAKWSGCENPVRYAGTLLRRLHPRHLRTYLHANAAGCGAEGGRIPTAESAIRATVEHTVNMLSGGNNQYEENKQDPNAVAPGATTASGEIHVRPAWARFKWGG